MYKLQKSLRGIVDISLSQWKVFSLVLILIFFDFLPTLIIFCLFFIITFFYQEFFHNYQIKIEFHFLLDSGNTIDVYSPLY